MKQGRAQMAWMRRAIAFGGLALVSCPLLAGDFSVGRVEVAFAEDGWTEIPMDDSGQAYGGDKPGSLRVQTRLYVRAASADGAQAFVLVSANSHGFNGGGAAKMVYSPDCRSDKEIHREGNAGVGRPFAQCLAVMPRYTSESLVEVLTPQVKPLRASGVVPMSRLAYSVTSRHAISNGTFVDVRVIFASPLDVPDTQISDALPDGVPPAHVVWGRQLKDAVKSSVYSLSGRLNIPPLRMIPPAPTGPTLRG
ncbi:MAG: hypothetical protein KF871_00660 [Hydrogenophaga sp.]|uniref:hypothetical protein n=1 Tax=Hydrogenophaga sp. TaxID=1904254 RepID=UPI001DBFA8EC|nr:hypothetical protein [Hydrogenophaga sp.]MBX3608377.1 hypothetical protein [Hydrogenophaga sp.]